MLKIPKTYGWASGVACVAIALAAYSVAFAQNQQSQRNQIDQSQYESQTAQQTQQSEQQSRRDEQQYGRDAQSSEQSESRWSDSDRQGASLGVNISSDDGPGVIVIRVHRGSPAEEMGLETRDRITRVNGRPVPSIQEFISMIREMNPGEQVELDIERDRDQRSFRGELQSRAQALVLRAPQQDRANWQTSYDEERADGSATQRPSGDTASRLNQIERQVDRLSQQIEDLRIALRDIRGPSGEPGRFGRERTAGYDEPQGRTIESPRRAAERWNSDANRYRQGGAQRSRQFDGQSGQRTRQQSASGQSGQRSGQSGSGQSGQRSGQQGSGQDSQRSGEQSDSDQSSGRSSTDQEERPDDVR